MKIYIEVVLILALVFIYLFWKVWESFSQKRLAKKYNPDNDKSRKGGAINYGELKRTERGVTLEPASVIRPEQPEGRELFQETTSSDVGKDSNIPRENSPGVRKLLRRSRKN